MIKSMKVVQGYPPNYEVISAVLKPPPHAVFCFGDVIYNPSNRELTPDVEYHESIHSRQQGSNPDAWYTRYLTDRSFRLSQELEAYGEQYQYARQHIGSEAQRARSQGKQLKVSASRLLKWALDSMATALSGEGYGNLLTYGQARSKIRNYRS